MQDIKILTAGDSAILIEFGNDISPEINQKIKSVIQLIREQNIEGIVDMIPAFCSLLISYDPRIITFGQIEKRMNQLVKIEIATEESQVNIIHIPVCYGGIYGPDMETVVKHSGMTEEEIISLHSSKDYLIYMLGFLPGFSYLGGLDERLHTPRLANPRIKINAGSVGIGGAQTGIYPLDSPGGWQLIGMTPVKTYDPEREVPIIYEAGDYIRFVPVNEAEYEKIEKQVENGTYEFVIHKGGVV